MLPHLRPVRVVLTPLHLRVSFCDRFMHLVLLLLLRENLYPSICLRNPVCGIAGGRLAGKVVCVLCTYSGSTQTTGLGFRTARFRLFGSSVIPVGSADWRSRSEVKGDIMAVHTRAVSCPLAVVCVSMRTDQDRCISSGAFLCRILDPRKCSSECAGGIATGLNLVPRSSCSGRRGMTAAEWRPLRRAILSTGNDRHAVGWIVGWLCTSYGPTGSNPRNACRFLYFTVPTLK